MSSGDILIVQVPLGEKEKSEVLGLRNSECKTIEKRPNQGTTVDPSDSKRIKNNLLFYITNWQFVNRNISTYLAKLRLMFKEFWAG
jgi:hypothetical protein